MRISTKENRTLQMPRPTETVLGDSCFWIALVDSRDQHHVAAGTKALYLDMLQVLIPWPCLYETVSNRMMRNKYATVALDALLSRGNITLVDDSRYRDAAYEKSVELAKSGKRYIALVDMIIRMMCDDEIRSPNYLLTFNEPDFRDVCISRRIEIL